ncbi:MAG: hypothetical protein V2I31_13565 [Mariniphaga sp.]|jgi:hypothetical protein|nr:hypothetical protein [Mariniphaga sp.]
MAYLGDYLGQLMSEITMARMQADLEAVRIAELYSSHPLLKNLPIPHFRLPEVELDVPVVIKNMEEPEKGESPRGTTDVKVLRKEFDVLLSETLKGEGIKLKQEQLNAIKNLLDKESEALLQPKETANNVNYIADHFARTVTQAIIRMGIELDRKKTANLEIKIKTAGRLKFQNLRSLPPRLSVLVRTAEVKEAGSKENITILRLKLGEEAFEWSTIETENGPTDKLVIE